MTEKTKTSVLPEAETVNSGQEATIPNKNSEEILIPIKFNKEVKKLTVEEAAALAQKGMKYDLMSDILNTLKELSADSGKSVTQFLNQLKQERYSKRKQFLEEKCGGDGDFAEHILKLENEKNESAIMGFEELQKHFPQFKALEQLPEEVLQAAELKGTLLLDEYLRYRLVQNKAASDAAKKIKLSEIASVGSQLNRNGRENAETAEFLKGLWN